MSKSKQILKLLAAGKTPKEVAQKLKVKPQYVYVVRSVNKRKKSKIVKAVQTTTADIVKSPPHYKTGGLETIDFIEAKDLNYRLGNVVKYVARAGKKLDSDPLVDLKKARWYLDREIFVREGA